MQTRAGSRKRKFKADNAENFDERIQVSSNGFDWNQLPIELWLAVSKHLPYMEMFQLRRVNKTFKRAIDSCISLSNSLTNFSLCRNGLFCTVTHKMIEQTFSPPNRWQTLKVLDLLTFSSIMDSTNLVTISKNAKNLEEISISCKNIKQMQEACPLILSGSMIYHF